MSRLKILTVVGARPQFVKVAPVGDVLAATEGVSHILVHTGQHYDRNMSDVFFEDLGIAQPDYHLGVGSGAHGAQTAAMLDQLERVLEVEAPNVVLVYGDTNSTLAAALAASKMHIPVAHVEAGLRSFNRRMPEEINRVCADHLSDILFAPTKTAVENLIREGLGSRALLVGDVMYDATLRAARGAPSELPSLSGLGANYVLATIHRAENTDNPQVLQQIVDGLVMCAESIPVVFPLHPRTRSRLDGFGITLNERNGVRVIEPIGYSQMVSLQKAARVIVTDSGGVQKEAYFHRVPCVTLRAETEWTELVDAGWNRLVPPISARAIAESVSEAMRVGPGRDVELYGDGTASSQIVNELIERYG